MEIKLFLQITFLAVCLALIQVAIISRLYRKYAVNFLGTYLFYLILITAFGFFSFIAKRITQALMLHLFNREESLLIIGELFSFWSFPLYIVALFLLIRVFREMSDRRITLLLTLFYFVFLSSAYIAYGIILFYSSDVWHISLNQMLNLFPYAFVSLNIIATSYAIIPAFFIGSKLRFRHRAKILRFTATIHLIICLVMDVFYLIDHSVAEAIFILLYFGGCLPVVLYLSNYFSCFGAEAFEILEIERLHESYKLTNREIDICQLLGEGKTNDQIADILYISLQTVKTHIHNIFNKTGVKNRVQLSNLLRQVNSNIESNEGNKDLA